jgi:hypothetical protein
MHDLELTRRSDHRADVGEACPTCGMILKVAGVRYEGRSYCCHGCVPYNGEAPHAQHVPGERKVEVVRAVHVAAAPEQTSAFIRDLSLLHLYEQKLRRIEITAVAPDGKTACATASGYFGYAPYTVDFHFDLQKGGYQSTMCTGGPIEALSGSFLVLPSNGGSEIHHVESYELKLGALGAALARTLKPYVAWSMERELRTLAKLIDEPDALGEALRIREPRNLSVDPKIRVWDPIGGGDKRGLLARAPSPMTLYVATAFVGGVLATALFSRIKSSIRD